MLNPLKFISKDILTLILLLLVSLNSNAVIIKTETFRMGTWKLRTLRRYRYRVQTISFGSNGGTEQTQWVFVEICNTFDFVQSPLPFHTHWLQIIQGPTTSPPFVLAKPSIFFFYSVHLDIQIRKDCEQTPSTLKLHFRLFFFFSHWFLFKLLCLVYFWIVQHLLSLRNNFIVLSKSFPRLKVGVRFVWERARSNVRILVRLRALVITLSTQLEMV